MKLTSETKVLVCLVILAILYGLHTGATANARDSKDSLDVKVAAAPKPEYCEITVRGTNVSDKSLILKFDTAQRYDFYAKDQNQRMIWQWSNEIVFANVQSEITLKPGQALAHTVKWKYVRNDGRRVKGGKFWIMGAITSRPQNRYSKPVQIDVPEGVSTGPALKGQVSDRPSETASQRG